MLTNGNISDSIGEHRRYFSSLAVVHSNRVGARGHLRLSNAFLNRSWSCRFFSWEEDVSFSLSLLFEVIMLRGNWASENASWNEHQLAVLDYLYC